MKKTNLLFMLITLIFHFTLAAQITIATGIDGPNEMVLVGDKLYVAGYLDGNIYEIDLLTNTKEAIVTGLTTPYGLSFDSNTLYYSQRTLDKISKIDDITGDPLVSQDILTNIFNAASLLINGSDLYTTQINNNQISKVANINSSPASTLFASTPDAGPTDIILNGNTMYIAGRDDNKVLKIADITADPLQITDYIDFGSPFAGPAGLFLDGSTLYISCVDGNKIVTVNINDASPTPQEILTVNKPSGILVRGTELFIAENENDQVSVFDLTVLSISKNEDDSLGFDIFPNPTKEFIRVSGLEKKQDYEIYNLLGMVVKKGIVSDNEQINIKVLANGTYILKLDVGNTVKIIRL